MVFWRIFLLNLAFLVQWQEIVSFANFNLFLTQSEVKRILGLNSQLYYVREGMLNEYALGWAVKVDSDVDSLFFRWHSLAKRPLLYNMTAWSNATTTTKSPPVLLPPSLNITSSGTIPRTESTFRLDLYCTGQISAEVEVILSINVTSRSERTPTILALKRRKICLKGISTAPYVENKDKPMSSSQPTTLTTAENEEKDESSAPLIYALVLASTASIACVVGVALFLWKRRASNNKMRINTVLRDNRSLLTGTESSDSKPGTMRCHPAIVSNLGSVNVPPSSFTLPSSFSANSYASLYREPINSASSAIDNEFQLPKSSVASTIYEAPPDESSSESCGILRQETWNSGSGSSKNHTYNSNYCGNKSNNSSNNNYNNVNWNCFYESRGGHSTFKTYNNILQVNNSISSSGSSNKNNSFHKNAKSNRGGTVCDQTNNGNKNQRVAKSESRSADSANASFRRTPKNNEIGGVLFLPEIIDIKEKFKQLQMDRERLRVTEVLQEGDSGRLVAGWLQREHPELDQQVLVKTLQDSSDGAAVAALCREGTKLAALRHSNVLSLVGISIVNNAAPFLVYPDPLGNNLKYFLESKCVPLQITEVVDICLQASKAVAFLHANRLVHEDIAARNCIISENLPFHVRLTDGALSRDFFPEQYESVEASPNLKTSKINQNFESLGNDEDKQLLPARWMAPELFKDYTKFSQSSDVWSLGMLIWEVSCGSGTMPFANLRGWHSIAAVVTSGGRPAISPSCPDDLALLMGSTWAPDLVDRATAHKVTQMLTSFKETLKSFV